MIILILQILGWYILHWFVHYKVFHWISYLNNEEVSNEDRKTFSLIALIPIAATCMMIVGFWVTINEGPLSLTNKFLTFIDNIGKKEVKWGKEKIEEHKEVKKIKKAEKDKISSRFELLDL